jgi:hypothetical protein
MQAGETKDVWSRSKKDVSDKTPTAVLKYLMCVCVCVCVGGGGLTAMPDVTTLNLLRLGLGKIMVNITKNYFLQATLQLACNHNTCGFAP